MKANRARVVLGLMFIAATVLCAQMAYGFLNVEVVKSNSGKERLLFKPAPDSDSIIPMALATFSVQRHLPEFVTYYDLSGDNIPDVLACGENQATAQVTCQAKNLMTNAVLASFNLLTPEYSVSTYPYMGDFNGDGKLELAAFGIKYADNSVWCQMKNPANGANIGSIFQVASAGIVFDEGFSQDSYVNVDGNSDTPEMVVYWRKASDQRVYCRVFNSATLVPMTPEMFILTGGYDMSLWTPEFGDVNADGRDELYAVARNRASGQTIWQVRKGLTGGLLFYVQVMGPSDYVDSYQVGQFEPTSPGWEVKACGWNTATQKPWCQVKRQNNSVFKAVFPVLGPEYIP